MKKGIIIDEIDNVGICTAAVEAGDKVSFGEVKKVAAEAIPVLHKMALKDIPCGEPVVKYGQIIGYATENIQAGQWVHVHNLDAEKMMR